MKNAFQILQTPTAKFIFVGNVPAALSIECSYGKEKEAYSIVKQVGMSIASMVAKNRGFYIKNRAFDTQAEAADFARSYGYNF